MTSEHSRPEETGEQAQIIEQAQFIEPNTHSFIVKVWRIDQDETKGKGDWRGHLTHVASGQRVYFNTLRQMNNFLNPYLEGLGVRPPMWWRVYRWLTQ